jgi:hypothetical protein
VVDWNFTSLFSRCDEWISNNGGERRGEVKIAERLYTMLFYNAPFPTFPSSSPAVRLFCMFNTEEALCLIQVRLLKGCWLMDG